MSDMGKKHKRGDRGSTEAEGKNNAKKQNMAASEPKSHDDSEEEDALNSSEENETNLKEIKSQLEGVQQTLLQVQTENRRMAAELTELKSPFNKHSTEISSLKTALKKAQNDNTELKRSVDSLNKKVEVQEHEINELYGQQDDLEQYTRTHALEIHGMAEDLYTHQRMTWSSSLASN